MIALKMSYFLTSSNLLKATRIDQGLLKKEKKQLQIIILQTEEQATYHQKVRQLSL